MQAYLLPPRRGVRSQKRHDLFVVIGVNLPQGEEPCATPARDGEWLADPDREAQPGISYAGSLWVSGGVADDKVESLPALSTAAGQRSCHG